jgi:hypothetical protein
VLYEQIYNAGSSLNGQQFLLVDAIDQLSAGSPTGATTSGTGPNGTNAERSYVGRLNYDYAGKYLLEAGFREDGSSYFAPTTRFGFFPYVSGGWRISEEPFIKNNVKWIDNIKIRASYGKLGDDAAAGNNYPQFATGYTYPAGGSVFANAGATRGSVIGNSGGLVKGVAFKAVANPNITWYSSITSDIGFESSFWNGKLTLEGDVFRRDRTGLLANKIVAIPGTFGASLPQVNLNGDRVQGYEATIGTQGNLGDLRYHVTANMGFTRRQLLHNEENPATSPLNLWNSKLTNRYQDQVWAYTVVDQFQNYQEIYNAPIQDGAGNRSLLPGDPNYKDINGDGVITKDYDQVPYSIGGAKPLVYFGMTIDASWKNIDLSLLIQGATKYTVTYQDQLGRPFYFSNSNPISAFYDRWHHENLFDQNSPWIPGKFSSTGQRQQYKDVGFNNAVGVFTTGNSLNIYDATYARLKQVQIGYTLPKKILSKAGISRVRIFATGYNVLTWKKAGLSFVDPEYTDTNLYGYNYPTTLNVNLGVQLTF